MVILGIDPGSARIGYGVIKKEGGLLHYVSSGLFPIPKSEKTARLKALESELSKLINKTKPGKIGLEKLFFFKNKKTVIEVAEARGVILGTIAKRAVTLVEPTPLEVKTAVTGDGRASKEAVARMVRYFLKLDGKKVTDDITDALAVAIAISNENPRLQTLPPPIYRVSGRRDLREGGTNPSDKVESPRCQQSRAFSTKSEQSRDKPQIPAS